MKKPIILGILNVTRDSFSDGGLYYKYEDAVKQALFLTKQGADIIDIGAASTHPDAEHIEAKEEIERIEKLVDYLQAKNITLSIDSYQTLTQQFALSKEITYLNDVQGFADPSIYPQLAESTCRLIMMHSIQRRGKAQRLEVESNQVWNSIITFFEQRLEDFQKSGIDFKRVIIDPGMGFFLSSKAQPSLFVLNHISELKKHFNLPVLISVSRKSFLKSITGNETQDLAAATLAAELLAVQNGADYIRTHNAKQLIDAITIQKAILDS